MDVKEKIKLERAAFPEQVGVSSAEIAELIKDFKESDIEVHSLMIISQDKVAFESWAAPYAPDIPHAMYSVSKSFTSTAIGFAIDEGLLTLDTKLIDIFPEYNTNEKDENIKKLNVHHLLSMQSGKGVSVFSDKSKNQWIKDFFDSTWNFVPGDGHWEYISENQYMLAAMLTRITGMSVIDYLTPRLFEPLGIDIPFWEHDINGIEAGGWGLFIKTEDLAKFTMCYMNNGMFNGRQVIPADWVRKAQMVQADNSPERKTPDCQAGYGYCFWRNAAINGYRADGMFSQFGIVAKDYHTAVIITAGEIDEQKVRDCLWRHFPKCLIEPTDKPVTDIKPAFEPLDDDLPSLPHNTELEKEIEGRNIRFQKNMLLNAVGFPVSMLPIPVVYMSGDRAGNISDVVFEFHDDVCTMSWSEGDERNTIDCGMDGVARRTPMTLAQITFTAVATAAWTGENELTVNVRPVEAVCRRTLVFRFDGNNVSFKPTSQQPTKALADNLKLDMDVFIPFAPLQKLGILAFDQLPDIVDAVNHGKFTE